MIALSEGCCFVHEENKWIKTLPEYISIIRLFIFQVGMDCTFILVKIDINMFIPSHGRKRWPVFQYFFEQDDEINNSFVDLFTYSLILLFFNWYSFRFVRIITTT